MTRFLGHPRPRRQMLDIPLTRVRPRASHLLLACSFQNGRAFKDRKLSRRRSPVSFVDEQRRGRSVVLRRYWTTEMQDESPRMSVHFGKIRRNTRDIYCLARVNWIISVVVTFVYFRVENFGDLIEQIRSNAMGQSSLSACVLFFFL